MLPTEMLPTEMLPTETHTSEPTEPELKIEKSMGFDLSGGYMKNLLSQMNMPDPRQLDYLNRGRKSLKTSNVTAEKLILEADTDKAARRKSNEEKDFGTSYDIPNVEDRLSS